uniref:RNA-binding protein 14 n=1 Tax=Nothobranchius furzeri TaxID=105023 RepID=A0A8C6KXE3_NOTFU
MVKIFIGNLACETTVEEVRKLFEKYGKVTECDIVKNYGFVHMSSMSEAEEAIKNLHQTELNGWSMNVELSKGRPKSTTKLHISNLGEGVTNDELRAKFEEFGPVVECDIVKNYAFVHMERMEDAMAAIDKLDNRAFKGKLIIVQLSTSRLRTAPGMGDHKGRSNWYPPRGMFSPPASDYMSSSGYSRASYAGGMPPPPPPPPRRPSAYDSPYSSVDYYEKYRARPYGSSYFEERHVPYIPPPPPPPASSLAKLSSSTDPYERRPLAPPPSAASYYAPEYSPIPRAPVSSGYSYETARLSPVSGSRSAYPVLRPKDPYAQRYAPY